MAYSAGKIARTLLLSFVVTVLHGTGFLVCSVLACKNLKCVDRNAMYTIAMVCGFVLDIAMQLVPFPFFSKLQLQQRDKKVLVWIYCAGIA